MTTLLTEPGDELPSEKSIRDMAREKWNIELPQTDAQREASCITLPHKLPGIGEAWPAVDGIYVGVSTTPEGRLYALVLLNERPAQRLAWNAAMEWAKSLDAQLPNRAEALLCFANVRTAFEKGWHWLSEQYSTGSAWLQYFVDGDQISSGKSFLGRVRAVRRFLIT